MERIRTLSRPHGRPRVRSGNLWCYPSQCNNGFLCCICPYPSGLLHWHWGSHCPSAGEVILKDMGKIDWYQTTTKHKFCVHNSAESRVIVMPTLSSLVAQHAVMQCHQWQKKLASRPLWMFIDKVGIKMTLGFQDKVGIQSLGFQCLGVHCKCHETYYLSVSALSGCRRRQSKEGLLVCSMKTNNLETDILLPLGMKWAIVCGTFWKGWGWGRGEDWWCYEVNQYKEEWMSG